MKIQIVDDNDTLVGLVERSEADYSKIIYRVSNLWLINSKNQVLLAKRSTLKDRDPGLWGPSVAGTIDEGETYDSNIYKEAEEEIGLTGLVFTIGPKVRFTYPRNYFCQVYYANVDMPVTDFTMQIDEVDELAWVDITLFKQELTQNPGKYTPSLPKLVEASGL